MPRIAPDDDGGGSDTASSDASTTEAEEEEYDRERTREELTEDAPAPADAPVDSTTDSTGSTTDSVSEGGLNDGRRATNKDTSTGQDDGTKPSSDSPTNNSSPPATGGVSDGSLNDGRRATNKDTSTGQDDGTDTSSGSPTDGSLPDGRRIPDEQGSSSGQSDDGQEDTSGTGAEVVNSSTTAQGAEKFGEGEVRSQASELESEVIENNEAITDESQVRVVQEGDSLRAELTTQGEEAVEQAQRQQVRQRVAEETEGVSADQVQVTDEGGETNVSLTEEGQAAAAGTLAASQQGGRRQIQEEALQNRVAESAGSGVQSDDVSVEFEEGVATASIDADVREVADRAGGQRDIQEESLESRIADSSGNAVDESEVDVAVSDSGDASVEISEDVPNVADPQGGRRSLQEESLENAAGQSSEQFDASNFEANVTDTGGSVALNDSTRASLIREQVAGQREEVQADDVTVSFDDRGGATVELDRSAREELAANQIASEREGVDADDVDVQFDEDGEIVGAEVEENFDDDGRFLGVPGAEDDVENVVNAVGDFTGGVGQGVGGLIGGAVQVGANVTGVSPEGQNQIADFSSDVGNRVGRSLNVTQLLTTSDELGEYIGESAARIYNGNADTIGPDTQESITRTVEPLKTDFAENPARATAGVVGSVAVTGGLFKAAQGTRLGGVARGTLQPGEEAFAAATGVRASTAARRGVSSAASKVPDIEARAFSADSRGQLSTGRLRSDTESETEADTDSDLGTPDDPFLVSDKRVYDPSREFGDAEDVSRFTDTPTRRSNSQQDIQDGISGRGNPETATGASSFEANFNQAIRSPSVDYRSGLPELDAIRRQTPEVDARTQRRPVSDGDTRFGLEATARVAEQSSRLQQAQQSEVTADEESRLGIQSRADVITADLDGSLARQSDAQSESVAVSENELAQEVEVGLEADATAEAELEAEAAVEQELETGLETGLESETRVETETRIEQRVEQESRAESRSEVAVESRFEVEPRREAEALDLDFAAGSSRRRPREDDGDEQRFDFGDLELL